MRQLVPGMLVVGLVTMGIGGCATAVRWEKSGASAADRQRDEADCMARASRESAAPSAQSAVTSPAMPVDPQRARTQGYDAAVLDECMAGRGYTRISPRPSS